MTMTTGYKRAAAVLVGDVVRDTYTVRKNGTVKIEQRDLLVTGREAGTVVYRGQEAVLVYLTGQDLTAHERDIKVKLALVPSAVQTVVYEAQV